MFFKTPPAEFEFCVGDVGAVWWCSARAPEIDPVPAAMCENDPPTLPDVSEQRPLRQRRATVESGLSHYDREGRRAMDLVPQTAAHAIAPSQVVPETIWGTSSQVRERAGTVDYSVVPCKDPRPGGG